MTKSLYLHDRLPSHMMDLIERELSDNFDPLLEAAKVGNTENFGSLEGRVDLSKRNSKTAWVPTTNWIGGLMWHYYNKVNNEIFHYDLDCIDGEAMQYTHYGLNEKYDWHRDEGLTTCYKPQSSGRFDPLETEDFSKRNTEKIRKLSAIIQLADPDDYEGGSTQILNVDQSLYTIPKERGTIVFFDSRLKHRAKPVTNGLRKSLVIWAIGPRWR